MKGRRGRPPIVPTLQRGNAAGDAPASDSDNAMYPIPIVPTLQRGNAAGDAPASDSDNAMYPIAGESAAGAASYRFPRRSVGTMKECHPHG